MLFHDHYITRSALWDAVWVHLEYKPYSFKSGDRRNVPITLTSRVLMEKNELNWREIQFFKLIFPFSPLPLSFCLVIWKTQVRIYLISDHTKWRATCSQVCGQRRRRRFPISFCGYLCYYYQSWIETILLPGFSRCWDCILKLYWLRFVRKRCEARKNKPFRVGQETWNRTHDFLLMTLRGRNEDPIYFPKWSSVVVW